MSSQSIIARGRIKFRPLLIWGLLAVLLALIARNASQGYPWGVDDGLKRLMARSFVASEGCSLILPLQNPEALSRRFFPIPNPFVTPTEGGYRAIFPALWSLLGGICFFLLGPFAFYLLPTGIFVCFIWLAYRKLKWNSSNLLTAQWGVLILSSALLFYSFTFWEHPLALIFLIPTYELFYKPKTTFKAHFLSGVALGVAIYLRPEVLLLYPLLGIALPSSLKTKAVFYLRLSLGLAGSLILAGCIERAFTGRWMPQQIGVNFGIAFAGQEAWSYLLSLPQIIISAPPPQWFWSLGLFLVILAAFVRRELMLVVIGLPILVGISLTLALLQQSAFGMTAFTQGLIFAFPWLGLGLVRLKDPIRTRLLILSIGFIILAYLVGPKFAGMHWGPRFLFPALFPLVIVAVRTLEQLPQRPAKWVMALTTAVAMLYGVTSFFALSQRGRACAAVDELISESKPHLLLVERWHEGADLEPLWGEKTILWIQNAGDLEELLIDLIAHSATEQFALLHSSGQIDLQDFPIKVVVLQGLPKRAGWSGDYLEFSLNGLKDERWGELYWHAARRRVEKGELNDATTFFRRAIEIIPRNPDLHYDLAVCLGRRGETAAAVNELKEALRLNPQHAMAASLLQRLGLP